MSYEFIQRPWLSKILKDVAIINYSDCMRQWSECNIKHPDGLIMLNDNDLIFEGITKENTKTTIGGIDIPTLIRSRRKNKGCIAIIGIDPRRNRKTTEHRVRDKSHFLIGTPYAVHCKTALSGTEKYRQVIDTLLEKGYNVYLTDRCKVYLSKSKGKKENLLKYKEKWNKILANELDHLNKENLKLIIYMGGEKNLPNCNPKGPKTMWLPHLASPCCWSTIIELMGKSKNTSPNKHWIAEEFIEWVTAKLNL